MILYTKLFIADANTENCPSGTGKAENIKCNGIWGVFNQMSSKRTVNCILDNYKLGYKPLMHRQPQIDSL